MAAQIRALLAPQARDKGLRLALQIAPGTPRLIEADRKHIEEIIFNLVGNAIKFTTSGHVLIRLGAAVPLSADASARLILTVTDTGAGIPPEAQSRIFERFSQADETIVDRFGGTGLGLAICKQLVELQGGTIGVTASPAREAPSRSNWMSAKARATRPPRFRIASLSSPTTAASWPNSPR